MADRDDFRVEEADASSDESRALVTAYVEEIASTFPGGFDPAASVSADPRELTPPQGTFLVVRTAAGQAVGCGGVKRLDADIVEVKRMWIAPAARGHGLGRLLLEALEEAGRRLGATEAVLDTNGMLAAAVGLYRSSGWREVPPYNDNAYATHWFAKRLVDGASG